MRKVLLIFFLLLSSTLISQELNNPSVKGGFIYVDVLIEPYVDEFVEEATKRGFTNTRTIVFHELFHALYDMDHCHEEGSDIMCAVRPYRFTYAIFYDENNWQKALDKEFARIKK